jgi:hypothetical protein
MQLIDPQSLGRTLDAVSAALFDGLPIAPRQRAEVAEFIAARQGLPGAYGGSFALMEGEDAIQLFTGERTASAAARHIAGQECCRVLRLLGGPPGIPDEKLALPPAARSALAAATASLLLRVGPATPRGPKPADGGLHWDWQWRGGTFCCGRCSVALWRHLTAGGFDSQEARLARGLKCLRAFRSREDRRRGWGEWHKFPLWYTLSALVEMPHKAAVDEMRFVARRIERAAKGTSNATYHRRRSDLAWRVLSRV